MKTKIKGDVIFMSILLAIIGIVLLIPIAVTLVALICTSLVGGYIWLVFTIAWQLLLIIAVVIAAIFLIKWAVNKFG